MNNKTNGDLRHEAVVEKSLLKIAAEMERQTEIAQHAMRAQCSMVKMLCRTDVEKSDSVEEPLPCPCCGGKAHVNVSASDPAMGYVACDDTLGCGLTNGFDEIALAVKRWNRRGGAA